MVEKGLGKEVQAVLLEMEIASLDQSLDKKETSVVVATLVAVLLALYDEVDFPIRRAR